MVVLESQRLLFRDHEIGDLEPFCAMEADPEVRRYVGGNPRSHADAEHKFRSTYLKPRENRLGLWATVLKATGSYVGYCGVYPHFGSHAPIPGEGTLAFYLAPPYWGLAGWCSSIPNGGQDGLGRRPSGQPGTVAPGSRALQEQMPGVRTIDKIKLVFDSVPIKMATLLWPRIVSLIK